MASSESEPRSELKYGPVKIHFDEVLGSGAYGEVFRAKYGQLPCAAKLLHGILFRTKDPNMENALLEKFWEECSVLRITKHPNIIQYLGTTIDETSKRPVLLMELMDESLTMLLDRSKTSCCPLQLSLQITICNDVALALAFLHSNDIMHRDLSSNNVLLIAGRRAKIADFGVSTIIDKQLTHLTKCPGSKVYMPPEALIDCPRYMDKLDCFSFGVLTVQIAMMNYPDPGPHSKLEEHPDYPTGRIQVFVPEIERRRSDIDLIDEKHPLLPIAQNCLKDKESERPSTKDICDVLVSVQSHSSAIDVKEQSAIKDNSVLFTVENLKKEMEGKSPLLEGYQKEYVGSSERQMGMQFEKKNEQNDCCYISGWRYEAAPDSLSLYDGVALFDVDRAYFLKRYNLYLYQPNKVGETWSKLVSTHYEYSGLAMINRKLTTVGGWNGIALKSHILSLTEAEAKSKMTWKEELPKLPTGRWLPACLSTANHLIVAGGYGVFNSVLSCVEVLDTKSRQWSTATNIPNLQDPQVIRCGSSLYLSSSSSDLFFHCKINDLFKSFDDTSTTKKVASSLWVKVQSPPHRRASIITFRGQILTVGGESEDGKDIKQIYLYSKENIWWYAIGEMPTARKLVLAGILCVDSSSCILCVGGQSEANSSALKIVEAANVELANSVKIKTQ